MFSMFDDIFLSKRSNIVMAVIASTTTTALGTIIGSCLPLIFTKMSSPDLFTVFCSLKIDGVGLKYALKSTSLPCQSHWTWLHLYHLLFQRP